MSSPSATADEPPSYRGYRYPVEIISHAVWLYFRFHLSLRDVEELLAERGVTLTYATISGWCAKCGPSYAARLRRRTLGDLLELLLDACPVLIEHVG